MSAAPRPRGPRRDRRGGYLLIEALATLAVSAFVLAGLLGLSTVLLRAGDRAAARVERMESEPRAIAAIAREVRKLVRMRWAGEGDRFLFVGEPDRIAFALAPVQANGLRSPVAVAYQAPGPGVVLRAEGPVPRGATGAGDIEFSSPQRIGAGPDALRFAYVERLPNGFEVITETWDKPDALPAAVRIDRVDGRGLLIASLRVPVMTQAEPGCAAPGKGFCSRIKKDSGQPGAAGEAQAGNAPAAGKGARPQPVGD